MKALCGFAECSRGAGDRNDQEEQPLRRLRAPDRLAFRELVERLQGNVFSVCYALLGDAQEADEAAQKVFVTIHRKAHYVDRERDDLRWVYQLVIKQCLHALRTHRLRKCFAWFTERSSRPWVTELSGAPGKSQQVLLFRALSIVPNKERALLVLREVADQPVEDIAAIMRMDTPAVQRRLFVARKRLLASLSSAAEK